MDSEHSGRPSAGEVKTPSFLASPGLVSQITLRPRLGDSDAEMGIEMCWGEKQETLT